PVETVQEYQEEHIRLRGRMAREGEVDPASIQRFEEEETRLNDLEEQRLDLDSAAKTLRQTIERLTDTSRRRFVQTFEAVSAHFAELIPRLFGGGRGALVLLDP